MWQFLMLKILLPGKFGLMDDQDPVGELASFSGEYIQLVGERRARGMRCKMFLENTRELRFVALDLEQRAPSQKIFIAHPLTRRLRGGLVCF